jgi:fructokinase
MVAWSIGEILWDVFPSHEQLGGAPLNFSANLQRLGDEVTFLSAVGKDERGRLALQRMRELGLTTVGVREVDSFPTGTAIVGAGSGGDAAFVIPRPAAFDKVAIDPQALAAARGVDWLYFGTLLQTDEAAELLVADLAANLAPARCFYDINLRTGHWNLPLVLRLCKLATVLKLNESEAETLHKLTQTTDAAFSLETFCAEWSSRYAIDTICVTLGPAGCLVYDRGVLTRAPGYEVTVCDTVGSGDAFAAAFLHGYSLGWPMQETARFANALGALVASRAGATPDWTVDEVWAMVNN